MMQNVKRRNNVDLKGVGEILFYLSVSLPTGLIVGYLAHLIY